jgi:hypothetical protein
MPIKIKRLHQHLASPTKAGPACGVLKFVVRRWSRGAFSINAAEQVGNEWIPVGLIHLDEQSVGRSRMPSLVVSMVKAKRLRCGVGTRIYEQALKLACKHQRRLTSDTSRTVYSEKFWRKQVRKGRARCIDRSRPAAKLTYEDGYFAHVGEWPCLRYRMKTTCPQRFELGRGRR